MFMTEQGAGSDVAATATRAEPSNEQTWRLWGDKWFCSNPDADLAMVLARSEDKQGLAGISLFLLPKTRQDGTPNAYPGTALREGASGQNVRLVQFWLKIARTVYSRLNSITVDGRFGAATGAAAVNRQGGRGSGRGRGRGRGRGGICASAGGSSRARRRRW